MHKKPHEFTPQETLDNAMAWNGEEYLNALDRIYTKFSEIAGTEEPDEFMKRGYSILVKSLPLNGGQLRREMYVLRRGKDRIITAVEIIFRLDKKKMDIVTKSLNAAETKRLLGGN